MASWAVHYPCFVHLQIVQCKQGCRVPQAVTLLRMTQGNAPRVTLLEKKPLARCTCPYTSILHTLARLEIATQGLVLRLMNHSLIPCALSQMVIETRRLRRVRHFRHRVSFCFVFIRVGSWRWLLLTFASRIGFEVSARHNAGVRYVAVNRRHSCRLELRLQPVAPFPVMKLITQGLGYRVTSFSCD